MPGATVLTWYRALGDEPGAREALLNTPWASWRDAILAELAPAHPDLASQTQRIDIVRYGHAMAVPVPGVLSQIAQWRTSDKRQQLLKTEHLPVPHFAEAPRLRFAHSDWAGYSVFEEAFTLGHAAGLASA